MEKFSGPGLRSNPEFEFYSAIELTECILIQICIRQPEIHESTVLCQHTLNFLPNYLCCHILMCDACCSLNFHIIPSDSINQPNNSTQFLNS